ncbi:PQQ-binding-like beta-propeller repeat protein [Microlunatus parietis]|uniref:Uncharacterized protein n=1 Tax=Microlunatus parietis TaxID=682979 RepID=A0A7Y9IEZ5_9ACTN|nr:hypothetical protein [Microlunatus parietis]NYE75411.1 hypothetical protein [Microlunatus parietis]
MLLSRRSLIIGSGATAALTLGRSGAGRARAEDGATPVPRPIDPGVDLGRVVIVAPDRPAWQQLGAALAAGIAEAAGVPVPTVAVPEQAKFETGWAGPTILLGQLGNNVQLARLYGMRFAMVDSWFPGPGGHWIRTLVDPFGLGGNTVVLGAGDLAGAEAAVTALIGAIDGSTLGLQHRARLADAVQAALPNDGVADDAYLNRELADADALLGSLVPSVGVEADAVRLHSVLNEIRIAGEAHLLTADVGFARLHRHYLLGYAAFVNEHPEPATNQLNNNRNMWTNGEELISVWAVLEGDGRFSEDERAQVLAALHTTFAANANDSYLIRARPEAPRWNHEAYPALSLVAGADYFLRHHDLPAARDWYDRGAMIFAGNTAVISLDEGADYLMHLPMITMDYGMFTGQLDYLNRTLRPSADLNALMIDNLGMMVGGGDVYPFGYSGVYSWGHSQVMHAATWLFGDPLYALLQERARTGPFSGQRMPDLDFPLHRYLVLDDDGGPPGEAPAPPAVRAYPIEPGVYDDLTATTPSEIPQDRTFHKLAFRAGLGIDAPCLMLDGFTGGRHNHLDGNAIIGYSAHQRLFLTDRDYMENTPEHHSGVVVVRNGEQQRMGAFTRIDWVADVEGAAVSRSTVPAWNGTDWTRTVITVDGGFHLILDDVRILDDGSYLIKNQWQALGTGTLAGHRFHARQRDASMIIDSLDDSRLQTRERYGHFRKYFKSTYPYPFADQETVLSQLHPERARSAGDAVGFVNVLASGPGTDPGLTSRRWGGRICQVELGDRSWWLVRGRLQAPELASDGEWHLIGPDRLIIAGATMITLAGTRHRFGEEAIVTVSLADGSWAAYPVRRDLVRYDEQGDPIRPGPIDQGSSAVRRRHADAVLERLRPDHDQKTPPDKIISAGTSVPKSWRQLAAVSGRITATHRVTPFGDGHSLLLVGTEDGRVVALTPDGRTVWSATVSGRVNEIAAHVHDEDQLVTVATEGWRVHALSLDGRERWVREIPNTSARREIKGNLLGITTIRLGYVNGRGQAPWLMVGTQFRWVYGLDWAGTIKHETMLYFYGIEDAVFADFDGDGRDEGAYALEYFYPVIWDDKTSVRGPAAAGPGFTAVGTLEQADGPPSIVYGTKQNDVRSYRYAGGKLVPGWSRNVGGQVTTLTAGTFHAAVGQEIILGTTGFQAISLGADGRPRFRAKIGDTVRFLVATPQPGYLAAADHGLLVGLDPAGRETGRWRFPEWIAGVEVAPGEAMLVVLADGRVFAR